MKITKTLNVDNRMQWRQWLAENHDKEKEIWLIYHKRHVEVPTISYAESVEEALCYGWVEGLIRKVDDERYARRFTPRAKGGSWSRGNVKLFERLIREGRVQEFALKSAPNEKTKVYKPLRERRVVMSKELKAALDKDKRAKISFEKLAPSYRRLLVFWAGNAKRPETRVNRVKRIIKSLKAGKKLWSNE